MARDRHLTGDALGKPDQAQALLDEIDADIAARAAENPEFAGKTVAFVWDTAGVFSVWNENDPRVEILLDLGFVNAPAVDELDTGETSFSFPLSYDYALDELIAELQHAVAHS